MNTVRGLVAFAVLGGAVVGLVWWSGLGRGPAMTGGVEGADRPTPAAQAGAALEAAQARQHADAKKASAPDARTGGTREPPQAAAQVTGARPEWADLASFWPVQSTARTAGAAVAASGDPEVPTRLAFRALWYLGVDPEAEKTWTRAINDLRHPPGIRSDLIVDMIDEGYSDNSHPTKADLPTILARLEILERHAPYAIDQVNADAFARAYEQLLALYLRLGGEPRGRK